MLESITLEIVHPLSVSVFTQYVKVSIATILIKFFYPNFIPDLWLRCLAVLSLWTSSHGAVKYKILWSTFSCINRFCIKIYSIYIALYTMAENQEERYTSWNQWLPTYHLSVELLRKTTPLHLFHLQELFSSEEHISMLSINIKLYKVMFHRYI